MPEGRETHSQRVRLLAEDVSDVPPQLLALAIKAWLSHEERCRYMPMAGDLIALAKAHQKRETKTSEPGPFAKERAVNEEARRRMAEAVTRPQIEAAAAWERKARQEAGLSVPPHQHPLSRDELDALPAHVVSLGIKSGLLVRRDGTLHEAVLDRAS
jgi:hypothetical protein